MTKRGKFHLFLVTFIIHGVLDGKFQNTRFDNESKQLQSFPRSKTGFEVFLCKKKNVAVHLFFM